MTEFDPSVQGMLDLLCMHLEIPNSWSDRSKAQAVIQHYWKVHLLELQLVDNPDELSIKTVSRPE